jgi:hypothetical protein
MMGTLLICISKMATPGRLQFSYDLYRRYQSTHHFWLCAAYWFIVTLLWLALFISLFTGLLWRCCDCGVVYFAAYWFIVTLLCLWRCFYRCLLIYCDRLLWLWRCLYRCLLVYYDVVVTVALFISLLTDLLWPVVVIVALFISLFTGLLWLCCDCGVVYIAVYWFIVTLLWLWRCLYSYPEIEGTFLINIHHI